MTTEFDSLDDLFAAAGEIVSVNVPGIRKPIRMRQLAIDEVDELMKHVGNNIRFSVELCSRIVVKDDGKPMFTAEEWGRFGTQQRDHFNAIVAACMDRSGVLPKAKAEALGNASEATTASDSSSPSPSA